MEGFSYTSNNSADLPNYMGLTSATITSVSGGNFYAGNVQWDPNTTWYPQTYTYWYPQFSVDKTRQAFQILEMLEKKKLIQITDVKMFIRLVNELYQIL